VTRTLYAWTCIVSFSSSFILAQGLSPGHEVEQEVRVSICLSDGVYGPKQYRIETHQRTRVDETVSRWQTMTGHYLPLDRAPEWTDTYLDPYSWESSEPTR
jgi:hypothetical protein